MYVKSYNDRGIWKDISLTDEEEEDCIKIAEINHNVLMQECIIEAKKMCEGHKIEIPMAVVEIAKSLFDKRAIHVQYAREAKAREVFENIIKSKSVVQSINSKCEEK